MKLLACAAVLFLAVCARAGTIDAPSASVPPLGRAAALTAAAPDLGAGAAYLGDPAARLWMDAHRPDAASGLTARALSFEDWRQTLAGFDNPRKLREALLAPGREELARNPERTLALTGHDGDRAVLEKALLEWRTLEEPVARRIGDSGVTELEWMTWPLEKRLNAAHTFAQKYADQLLSGAETAADYAAASQEALRVLGPLSLDEAELLARTRRFEQEQRVVGAVSEAEREAAGFSAPAAEPEAPATLGLSAEQRVRLATKLHAELLRQLRAAPAGCDLADFYRRSSLILQFSPAGREVMGQYDPHEGAVLLGEASLVETLAALGRRPLELLDDEHALRELAMALSPLLVHEATHQRQFEDAADRGLTVNDALRFYNLDWEHEALTAQTAYVESRRRSDPEFAALVERMKGSDALDAILPWDELLRHPDAFADFLRGHYRRMPTVEGGAARLVARGILVKARVASDAQALGAELARRRRLPAPERALLERDGDKDPVELGLASLPGIATSRLRLLKREFDDLCRDVTATALSLMQLTRQRLADARARLDAAVKP